MKEKAKLIVEDILNELDGRGGFDGWWDSIDEDTQDDIKECLIENVLINIS